MTQRTYLIPDGPVAVSSDWNGLYFLDDGFSASPSAWQLLHAPSTAEDIPVVTFTDIRVVNDLALDRSGRAGHAFGALIDHSAIVSPWAILNRSTAVALDKPTRTVVLLDVDPRAIELSDLLVAPVTATNIVDWDSVRSGDLGTRSDRFLDALISNYWPVR
jgi:hypothetical protein